MPLTIVDGNPIKVTGTTAADEEILDKHLVHIRFIKWYKPTTVGHLCHITDVNGKTISKMNCDTANVSQIDPIFMSIDSIHCDDLDSGELYIYIR